MSALLPPRFVDFLIPVLIVFAAFGLADFLRDCGAIADIKRELVAAFVGFGLCWIVARGLDRQGGEGARRASG